MFADLETESEEYQTQLHKLLSQSTPDDFRYFFVTFSGNDQEFMVLNFRNSTQCFDVKLLTPHKEELKGMRRTNGMSYPKELFDVTWQGKLELI